MKKIHEIILDSNLYIKIISIWFKISFLIVIATNEDNNKEIE